MIHRVIKGYLVQSALLILNISTCSVACADETENTMAGSDKTEILSTIKSMTAAFHKKDINGVLNSYEDGAAIIFEPGAPISDPELLKNMFEEAFQINPNFDYHNGHEVYITNDIALHIAPWLMTGKAPDGTIISKSGLSIAVLRKQENGHWLMVLDNPNGHAMIQQKN